jgi:hypothetical protein
MIRSFREFLAPEPSPFLCGSYSDRGVGAGRVRSLRPHNSSEVLILLRDLVQGHSIKVPIQPPAHVGSSVLQQPPCPLDNGPKG